ncbi:glycosyltransferase family 4 protein [Actinobacillus equuli]|uniref:glycosyltransferase family 4 protein n=1 Tax=Actinobacillus equuli TaxID=718 RepID=UPI002442902F|nr:glycosyltransferase family 4 protein [Actinobacillus equuli]WGE57043.1 glycosyltransferase family 4 protein [Actinobacillus equuli subsp. equuli]
MTNILYLHAGAEMYGADKVLLDLIRGLDKSKFTPYVVLPCDGILVEELKSAGANVFVLDYPILRRKYFNLKGILGYFSSYFFKSNQLIEFAREYNISLIHNNTTAVLEGMYIAYKLKLPLLWHIHEIIVSPKFIYKIISFFLAKTADKIITVSDAVKDSYLESGFFETNGQIKTIYNGVDSSKYVPLQQEQIIKCKERLNIPADSQVVGMIGRINAWKGQSDFLEAIEPLLEENQNLYAVIVGGVFAGEEWRLDELKAKVAKIKHHRRIILLDFQKDTVELYNLFDIFVLPSTNPDPLPTVVLEAMACGKPVIGYAHGGITEMVSDNGYLVEVKQPKLLSNAIKELLDNPKKIIELSGKSIKRQKTYFSLTAYIHNFEKIYESLVKEK